MCRKLDILIPHYREDFSVIKPLLDSVAIQQNVDLKNDIGVIIVNDGKDIVLDKELFKNYEFAVEYYIEEHRGVSATRNSCLDHSNAEYILYADCDDMFAIVNALWIIMREINRGGFDTLVSAFYEESVHPETKEHFYIVRGDMAQGGVDSTFVHGKVHRRQYLLDKNIRWNDSLTIHEDSYFNCLAQKCTTPERTKYCPYPFYLWKWRDESVCRRDFKYILKTYNNMLDSNTALVEQFINRGMLADARYFCTSMIFDAYYTMNTDKWLNQDNKEYRDLTERRFKTYFTKFKGYFENIEPAIKHQIVSSIRNRFAMEGLLLESQTFDQWIKHIENLED